VINAGTSNNRMERRKKLLEVIPNKITVAMDYRKIIKPDEMRRVYRE